MAVLPEVSIGTGEVIIDDIQGNALPPAARGVMCDIDVGDAKPVAQRVCKVAPQFHEKVLDLIKGLLGSKIIQTSTSPWVSPIAWTLGGINDGSGSCDLGFHHPVRIIRVEPNAHRSEERPTDLSTNAGQRTFGFTRIPRSGFSGSGSSGPGSSIRGSGPNVKGSGSSGGVGLSLRDRDSDCSMKPSVLGRRSYIDDILVTAGSWDHLCERVDALLEACDEWNLSISVVKSFWGKGKVEYLDHRVSNSGLEANPKDLSALVDLPFPGTLRSMQSFLGSLNYYSRFMEHYAIYAAVLYELREVDFAAMSKPEIQAQIQTLVNQSAVDPGRPLLRDPRSLDLGSIPGDDVGSNVPRSNKDELSSPGGDHAGFMQKLATLDLGSGDLGDVVHVGSGLTDRLQSAILWKLPEWSVVRARSGYAEGLTVNEAEYHGLLLCMDLLEGEGPRRLVICGDSNLVIREVRGEIDCKAPGLTLLRQKALDRLRIWPHHELVHVKRDWNSSADSLASAALQRQGGILVDEAKDLDDLVTLNRLDEILVTEAEVDDSVAHVSPVTTRSNTGSRPRSNAESGSRSRSTPTALEEEVVRELRIERIRQAQDEESWILGLKKFLAGSVQELTPEEARSYTNIVMDYEVDLSDLLFYCPPTKRSELDRDGLMRLVVPETLQQDVLHHYHASLEGGHQGIGRTYRRIRDHFHWRGLYRSVQRYIGEIVDCETGKGGPRIQEASGSRTAQTIAESYEECVFRRFGASEMIRHDREPGFMADFFRSFNRILGQRQRATMAYGPQAYGTVHSPGSDPRRNPILYSAWEGSQIHLESYDPGGLYSPSGSGSKTMEIPDPTLLPTSTSASQHSATGGDRGSGESAQRRDPPASDLGWIPRLAIFGSGQRRVRTQTSAPVARAVQCSWEAREDLPDRPQIHLAEDVTDRLDFDETLLPEDS
ncbi:hypothetical protein ON010_g10836 [Phytophthora cinnamomi]|nr:hypothetical protein ON010_g10836 [Phytophthora cinnamomi]